jgi:hypothetical protein
VVSRDHPFPTLIAAGGADAECFSPVDIQTPGDPDLARAMAGTRVYRIVCP